MSRKIVAIGERVVYGVTVAAFALTMWVWVEPGMGADGGGPGCKAYCRYKNSVVEKCNCRGNECDCNDANCGWAVHCSCRDTGCNQGGWCAPCLEQ